jgi:hypothetical protein
MYIFVLKKSGENHIYISLSNCKYRFFILKSEDHKIERLPCEIELNWILNKNEILK